MRVTKTIRDYIEKEVRARIQPKYAAEEAEAKRRFVARDVFLTSVPRPLRKPSMPLSRLTSTKSATLWMMFGIGKLAILP